MVFSDAIHAAALWQVFCNVIPAFSAVRTLEKIGLEIPVFMIVKCRINHFFIVLRGHEILDID
ncbi:MAG: Uncharacterised protein [Flavobacteriales bacterium UBA4585]|nr:MAG: Uncharacterised protein [Flavobacteriales bacterium UBA4585]